jgi:hypothetical protein
MSAEEDFYLDQPEVPAPSVTRHADGQLTINWQGPRPKGWLKVDTEVMQSIVDGHNRFVRELDRAKSEVVRLQTTRSSSTRATP